jgi:serine phosphatase RsbU (regulator of sigma subunit)/anti-sigma regulatory factor (Ser/Thr protein kinase)
MMFQKLKIGSKILIMLSSVAIAAVGINAYFAYSNAKKSLEKESFNKLTAVREMKANQIEDYFRQIADQVLTFSENRMVIDAMKAFKIGFHAIDSEQSITDAQMAELDSVVKNYYQTEFLERLKANLEKYRWGKLIIEQYLPLEKNVKILQYLYIASNPYETGSKHIFDYAYDDSQYSRAHKKYHPIIRSYLKKFGYYDIFLVDHQTGHIVYTVFKEVDYGTSLVTGPYRDTNFADAFRAARDADRKDFVRLFDFDPYQPSYNAPAAFIASPIFEGREKIGVLLFQMPIDRINDIMTNKQEWSEVGLGKSGETYIVGEDFKIRNQSRFLIEDRDNYFKMIQKMRLPTEIISTKVFPDYRGVSVLSSYKPLEIPDVNWVIMSEIDEAEAFTYVYSLRNIILLLFLGLIVVIVVAAFLFSKTITRPLKVLTRYSRELSGHDFSDPVRLNFPEDLKNFSFRSDEIGDLVQAFNHMQTELEQSIENLKTTTSTKERMESELNIGHEIQMSMLPLLFPAFPDHDEFSVYAKLQSAREVGGDFFDFYFIDENRFCFCIGDVSGKGVPSALFMAVTKTLIKSRSTDDFSTGSIITRVNDELSRDNKAYMFATIFIGILDIRTGKTVYTNAGHNPPYLKQKNGAIKRLDNRHGPVIGAKTSLAYKEDWINLSTGDLLLIYTDGVTEARNREKEFYSEKRLAEFLSSSVYSSIEELVLSTVLDVKRFEDGADQSDDITLLAVQFLGISQKAAIPVFKIAVKNEMLEIGRVKLHFKTFAEQNGISVQVRRKVNVVFDEMLNNIISYAFRDGNEHYIQIRAELSQDRLSVTIEDDGIAFNPLDAESPDTDLSLEEREAGGLGIHVVRNVMDKVEYLRRIDKNIVTLVKYIEADNR